MRRQSIIHVVAFAVGTIGMIATANAKTFTPAEGVPPASASRTIVIGPATRWVNVTEHENVAFESHGERFAARFMRSDAPFDLNEIAPAGALDHEVIVYVAPDPLYLA